jgi:DNA-binding LacI/PurR family transcriptional regulator
MGDVGGRPIRVCVGWRGLSKTGSERQAGLRARLRKEGLRPHEVWVHLDDWPRVKRFIERLAKRRNAK